jgi:hypothetical protein
MVKMMIMTVCREVYVHVDFVVLDTRNIEDIPLILRRPLLETTNK